ncbi:MAG: MupG family TIM beta-alpha barrel fold protein [Propioniciclava sp.]|uniref:MupG family TIM beta-alpha barrel fold protein n=1 Tax=Propioniciclava sp. TaxID=2038686 RepID=UPI0039E62AE5
MLFSLYPTDSAEVRTSVLDAARLSSERTLFTSLHIPEADGLRTFVDELRTLHEADGFTFCADISPLTLDRLGLGIEEVGRLREAGVRWVRIDFGFDAIQIRRIADTSGLTIAVNASTADATLLDSLAGLEVAGWHNFYPRPETGLTTDFFRAQNALFGERGLGLFAFIPGELTFRAPLHLGLPTLEGQRHRNGWINYLQIASLCPRAKIVVAEGTIHPRHLEWIDHYEHTGEITVPLSEAEDAASFLLDGTWGVRVEQTDFSERLENTRGAPTPSSWINADVRARGSLQMDLPALGRYAGEVHVIIRDLPLHPHQARIGQIASPYMALVDHVRLTRRVRFIT